MTDTPPSPSQPSGPSIEKQIAVQKLLDTVERTAALWPTSREWHEPGGIGFERIARLRATIVTLRAYEAQSRELAEEKALIKRMLGFCESCGVYHRNCCCPKTEQPPSKDAAEAWSDYKPLAEARKEIERLTTERDLLDPIKHLSARGHEAPCALCSEPCSSLAGNPSLWPVRLGNGGWWHVGCINKELRELARLRAPSGKDTTAILIEDSPQNHAISLVADTLLGNWPMAETVVRHLLDAGLLQEPPGKDVTADVAELQYKIATTPTTAEANQMLADALESVRTETEARFRPLVEALNYVADNTHIGTDAEWHFKKGYDPQIVLDALAALEEGNQR